MDTKEFCTNTVRHPAKFSDVLLPVLYKYLVGYDKILDPFAGTGKLKKIRPDAYLLEIEPEWANMGGAIIGDALYIPFKHDCFDAVCTSPTYGNRMADNFTERKNHYLRNTYTHAMGRKLSNNNSGILNWGKKYKMFHINVWNEVSRILKKDGRLILNISNHIRNGKEQKVSEWHCDILSKLCFNLEYHEKIETKRNRLGQNRARVKYENIFVFKNAKTNTI